MLVAAASGIVAARATAAGNVTAIGAGAAPVRALVDGPWGAVSVRIAGRPGDPTVILVHQMIWSAAQFRAAQPALAARGIRSIAIDLPGYGGSEAPLTPPPVAGYAEVILAVLRHFDLHSATLLGVNEGGTIASVFADVHPELVNRLILEGPVLPDSIELAKYFAAPRAYLTPRPDGSHLQTTWRGIVENAGSGLSAAGVQEIVQSVYAAGPSGWFAQEAAWRYDLQTVLGQIRVPVTLLTYPGQRFAPGTARATAARPDFAREAVDFNGVAASFDAPGPWADAVVRCLAHAL